MANHDETEKLIKKETKAFFNAELLKIIGVVFVALSPWLVWVTVSIFELRSEQKLQGQKLDIIMEMKQDISTIKSDVQTLKTDVAVIKAAKGQN